MTRGKDLFEGFSGRFHCIFLGAVSGWIVVGEFLVLRTSDVERIAMMENQQRTSIGIGQCSLPDHEVMLRHGSWKSGIKFVWP